MVFSFQINSSCGVPIYQQLIDAISSQIKSGQLSAQTRLPTVRELSEQLDIAVGTIKRAYDELERTGLVEKAQGRGTFVRAPREQSGRKDRAMAAIDAMLSELETLELSPAEIRIFLDLKLRERAAQQENLKVALVECNPEVLSQLPLQLNQIPGVELYPYLLSDVRAYPYRLGEEMDLIITTVEHANELEALTTQKKKLAKIVLRLRPKCVARIVKLQPGQTLGILCASLRFGRLLEEFCKTYVEDVEVCPSQEFSDISDIVSFLKGKDAILLPEGYEKYCSDQILGQLQSYGKSHLLIPCAYQLDEGSLLYATEILERLRERKQGPGNKMN